MPDWIIVGRHHHARRILAMPKLGKYAPLLKAVFFLYETRDEALAGVDSGGTGFLVAIPSKRWPQEIYHIHGLTNCHVAVRGIDSPPTPVIRLNKLDGSADAIEFDVSEWIFEPGKYDVAVSPPLPLAQYTYDIGFLDVESYFVTEQNERDDEIG